MNSTFKATIHHNLLKVSKDKAVHIDNPVASLSAAWDRLEHSFGSLEAIENVLFKWLQIFLKISVRDILKFQELQDLLLELQNAKTDTHQPNLNYLDTTPGVNSVVSKLLYNIQEKWESLRLRYMEEN